MAEPAPIYPIFPEPEAAGIGPSARPALPVPFVQTRIDRQERMRDSSRFGDLTGPQLSSILAAAKRGDIADWIDLCEFMLDTDDYLLGLYDTRISRVAQAEFIVAPNPFGDQAAAQQAATLVNELMGCIQNWEQAKRDLLDAIAKGVAFGQHLWDYDEQSGYNYIYEIEFVHAHRFRYDEVWKPRLYDRGRFDRKNSGSKDGEPLDPRCWTIHQHRVHAGYPGIGGLMRATAWHWLFLRWVEKFRIMSIEKHGSPMVRAVVPPNTPQGTRQRLREALERLSNDHVGVFEQGVEILIEAARVAGGDNDAHKTYTDDVHKSMAMLWLGATDIAEPGEHGSQSAVGTRASVTTDPRMVTDGKLFMQSLQATLWKQMIQMNGHCFSIAADRVPLPVGKLKTAEDEVETDEGGLQEEQEAEQQYSPHMPPSPDVPYDPKKDPAIESILEVVKAWQASAIPQQSAYELIAASGVPDERARRMVGMVAADTPAYSPPSSAPPKAPAPAWTGRTRTSPTSSRSRSPFANALRNGSAASASSSSKRSRMPAKR